MYIELGVPCLRRWKERTWHLKSPFASGTCLCNTEIVINESSFFFFKITFEEWRCPPLFAGTYIDKKCPFTGNVSIRGRIISGTCQSAKMVRTIIVRRDYLHFVKKYQRQEHNFLYASVFHLLIFHFFICSVIASDIMYMNKNIILVVCEPFIHSQFLYVNSLIHHSDIVFQIWEEALEHSSPYFPMLPCERRRLCYYWPMQVCIINCRVWSFFFPDHFISLFRIPISLLYLLYIYIYIHTHLKRLIYFTGLCQKQWGSMCWKSSLLALLVLGRRHLQGFESDWLL